MSSSKVPKIDPVSTDYYVACHYFPGWSVLPNGYSPFQDIRDFPERTPLMGLYDERDPEVFDWQAKWALEHGIRCFFYCWYRSFGSLGRKLTSDDAVLGHAIEAQKASAYGSMLDFAIMWECDNAAVASDVSDLTENLLSFWAENYFSEPNYCKIKGRPVVGVYDPKCNLEKAFGGRDAAKEALAALSEKSREYGFDGLYLMINNYTGNGYSVMDERRYLGFSQQFAYCWFCGEKHPAQETVVRDQLAALKKYAEYDPAYSILTCSKGWDPSPWRQNVPELTSYDETAWNLSPHNFRRLLEGVKELMDGMPENAPGRRIVLMDNWNEWCEGHYIMPHREGGFAYLQAIREVFTKCDNLPDYRLPEHLGLGPYDKSIDGNASRIWYKFD